MTTNQKMIVEALEKLYDEAVRLYEANNHGAYESGRIDGIKWAMAEVNKILK